MTPEELMRKRVIVENKWPGCPYDPGTILIKDSDWYWPIGNTQWDEKIHKDGIEPFPYLMRPIQWWEERKPEDMPEYVRVNTEHTCLFFGSVLKVRMWKVRAAGHFYCWVEEDKAKSLPDMFRYDPESFLPATETEYNEHLKSKL